MQYYLRHISIVVSFFAIIGLVISASHDFGDAITHQNHFPSHEESESRDSHSIQLTSSTRSGITKNAQASFSPQWTRTLSVRPRFAPEIVLRLVLTPSFIPLRL